MANYTYKDIVDKLITRIKTHFNVNTELSDKTNLLELKLDSLDIMSYIFYIEDEFHITIPDEDLEKGNFIIIEDIANYILAKT